MRKRKGIWIALATLAVVAIGLAGFYLYVIYSLEFSSKFDAEAWSELGKASSAVMGRALLDGRGSIEFTMEPDTGTFGGETIDACRADPEECERYANIFYAYGRARVLHGAIQKLPAVEVPASSEQLEVPLWAKTDPWGRPFCILRTEEGWLVVSLGPEGAGKSCGYLESLRKESTQAKLDVFELPSGEIVLLGRKEEASPRP